MRQNRGHHGYRTFHIGPSGSVCDYRPARMRADFRNPDQRHIAFGEFVFGKLGISLDALRIAGGIMLFIIGLNMVFEKRTEKRKDRAEDALEDADVPEDISVFPMGIPMIAGPGTMGSLLIFMSEANSQAEEFAILAALGVTLLVTFLSFLIAGPLMKLMGESFTEVLTRVLGVLLATLAVQFVIDGIKGGLLAGL